MSDSTQVPVIALTTGKYSSCIHCGARPEVPNRRQRRSLRKLGRGSAPLTLVHLPWCPLRVGSGCADRGRCAR